MKTNANTCSAPKLDPCDECGGSGTVIATDDNPNSPYARLYRDDCPACRGIGGFPDDEYLCQEASCPACPAIRADLETGYREQLADFWQGKHGA